MTACPIQKQTISLWGEGSQRNDWKRKDDDERKRRMVADRKRRLKDGREFDHLFPFPGVIDTIIKKSASVEDTMKLIGKALPQTLWQTEKIAKILKGRTLEETCSNIWHFVYERVQYKRDEDGVEQVRSPRRAWSDRKTGVDCDCYSVFILSILSSLRIPCVARITKYPKPYGEVSRWQHVYPIVPKPGHLENYTDDRDYYIVMDCVKDRFDDEEPYLECKDYDMRLDYLDGIESESSEETFDMVEHDSVDLSDFASIYDDEEMGNVFKKIGSAVKKTVQKVGDKVGDGIRILNRYTNPATILLRNGFLLAMKVNLMNVAGRLRYAYVSDSQAQAMNINMSELKKLRTVKDRAETVYWQAGGKKENLKKAILKGRGNKDKKVALSGLNGFSEEYADQDEYNIIHDNSIEGLGVIATGAAVAAATSAVAAIAGALKQVKGLFNKGGNEEQSFQSETDNAGSAASAPEMMSEDADAVTDEPEITSSSVPVTTLKSNEATKIYSNPSTTTQPILSNKSSSSGAMLVPSENASSSNAVAFQDSAEKASFIQKTQGWVKQNPGKSLLVAGSILAGSYLLIKAMKGGSGTSGLEGIPPKKQKQKKRKKNNNQTSIKKDKVKAQNLL